MQKLIDRRVQLAAKLFCEARVVLALLEQANPMSVPVISCQGFCQPLSRLNSAVGSVSHALDSALMMLV